MKIALVHELLTMKGGAERVLRVFADMFPDAPIYTLLYNEKKLGDWFPQERVIPSHLQPHVQWSVFNSPYNHHRYLSRLSDATEAWDFSDFDLVLSSSSAFVHNIITNGRPRHISYIHSPARYLWDRTHDVRAQAGRGFLGPLRRMYLDRLTHRLRIWDAESSSRADMLIAASHEVKRRIQLYWDRNSTVLHPPIDDAWLKTKPAARSVSDDAPFLVVSTLARYKRIELAIQACNELQYPLIIAGEGPDRNRLERLAGPTVRFIGYQEGDDLMRLYTQARALIFPGDEDFGLVPVEAMSRGCPVLAFRGGGALETVREHVTGALFDAPTVPSLRQALRIFDHKKYSMEDCRSTAELFNRSDFEQQLRSIIDRTIRS